MKVIGIAGKAGAGKNTVAGLLAATLVDAGHTVAMDAFAVDVKRLARQRDDWDGRKDAAGRALLQHVGGEMREGTSDDYWITRLVGRMPIDDATERPIVHRVPEYLIVPDVRYRNEADWVRKNGVLWWVTGRGGLTGPTGAHASETDLTGYPASSDQTEIRNSWGFDRLVALVRAAVTDGRHDRTLMVAPTTAAPPTPPAALTDALRHGRGIRREPFYDADTGEYYLEAIAVENGETLCCTRGHARAESALAELNDMIAAARA